MFSCVLFDHCTSLLSADEVPGVGAPKLTLGIAHGLPCLIPIGRFCKCRICQGQQERRPSPKVLENHLVPTMTEAMVSVQGGGLSTVVGYPYPSHWQATIVAMWAQEAEPREMLRAWVQRAYSWRTLVAALHRHGLTRRGNLNDYLNCFAL